MATYDLLVLGELNVDLILSGSDVTPVFGQVEKLVDDATLALGSSSAICACGAARLGLRVAFAGLVGDDDFGRVGVRSLQERGVDTRGVRVVPTLKTGLTVHLSHGDDRAMLTYPGAMAAFRAADVDAHLLGRARVVHVASFFLQTGLQAGLPALFAAARAHGALTSLDPGWDPSGRWQAALSDTLAQTDILLPNRQEALAISGAATVPSALAWLGERVPLVAVKLGAEGATAQARTQQTHCPGFAVAAVDTTGAGDTFDAGFLYARLQGLSLADSVRWACACGALATTRVGGIAGQPTLTQVQDFLAAAQPPPTEEP